MVEQSIESGSLKPGTTGRCLCGAIRYRLSTPPKWTALCHCESCRRACSAPVVAWMGFAPEAVAWTGERSFYRSSGISLRGFCNRCGTQMSFESTRWPGEIHLYAASLDDPAEYAPQLHCHHAEHLGWLHIKDSLPRYPHSADEDVRA
ncbi:GFA family protein [Shimia sp. SDUM112013]|uniref:GFA family protein n=1 Tax=Shimia sp. SDUM112013 TaxID=3136160 RepID=UPI0032F082D0